VEKKIKKMQNKRQIKRNKRIRKRGNVGEKERKRLGTIEGERRISGPVRYLEGRRKKGKRGGIR